MMSPDIDYEKMQIRTPSQKPPKLDVTQSDVKRTLEQKLDQPCFTVLGAIIMTKQAILNALGNRKSGFEDQSELYFLKEFMNSCGTDNPEALSVKQVLDCFATLQAIKIDNNRRQIVNASLAKLVQRHAKPEQPAVSPQP